MHLCLFSLACFELPVSGKCLASPLLRQFLKAAGDHCTAVHPAQVWRQQAQTAFTFSMERPYCVLSQLLSEGLVSSLLGGDCSPLLWDTGWSWHSLQASEAPGTKRMLRKSRRLEK